MNYEHLTSAQIPKHLSSVSPNFRKHTATAILPIAVLASLSLATPVFAERVSVQLHVGMWDRDERIHDELVAQAEAAGDRGESFDYVPPSLYLLVEGEDPDELIPRRVSLGLDSIGASFQYSGPRDVVFYLKMPDHEGKNTPEIAGRISLPTEGTRVLLLFLPDASLDTPYRILPINASGSNFPRGRIQVFNLSSKELLVAIDGSNDRINPRSQQVVGPHNRDEAFRFRFAAWDEDQDRWRIIFSRYQPPLQNNRLLCMIVDDRRRSGGVNIRFIRIPD